MALPNRSRKGMSAELRAALLSSRTSAATQVPAAMRSARAGMAAHHARSEEHTSELQSLRHIVCRLLIEKKRPNENEIHPRRRRVQELAEGPEVRCGLPGARRRIRARIIFFKGPGRPRYDPPSPPHRSPN